MFGKKDPNASQGLFLEGKIEYDNGNTEDARLMFYYGMKLDPEFAGNYYNYAVAEEKKNGQCSTTLKAWEKYLEIAQNDPNQKEEARQAVQEHVEKMKKTIKA